MLTKRADIRYLPLLVREAPGERDVHLRTPLGDFTFHSFRPRLRSQGLGQRLGSSRGVSSLGLPPLTATAPPAKGENPSTVPRSPSVGAELGRAPCSTRSRGPPAPRHGSKKR